jgi:hypothetical protein
MNIVHPNTVPFKVALMRVFLSFMCLIVLSSSVLAVSSVHDSVAVSAARATAIKDSIAQAQASAAENEEMQRKEKLNTILEVVGSVVAIIGLVLLTWKFSAGSGKKSKVEKHQGAPHSGVRR